MMAKSHIPTGAMFYTGAVSAGLIMDKSMGHDISLSAVTVGVATAVTVAVSYWALVQVKSRKMNSAASWIFRCALWTLFVSALAALLGIALNLVGGLPLNGWVFVACASAALGWALWPDIDEPNSTISRSLGGLSRSFSRVARKVSGGHRQGTHSLLGISVITAILAGVLYSASSFSGDAQPNVALGVVCASVGLLGGVALGYKYKSLGVCALIPAMLTGYLAAQGEMGAPALLGAVFVGCVGHVIGDMCTPSGIAFIGKKPASALLFTTNGKRRLGSGGRRQTKDDHFRKRNQNTVENYFVLLYIYPLWIALTVVAVDLLGLPSLIPA